MIKLNFHLGIDVNNSMEQKHPIPKVTIGMPVYNGERHIREALNSLLAQSFKDFELIISDNASTDSTGSICREYTHRDERIRYVRQSENRGIVANFQFVLDEARGEYFMWAAHDDVWDARWIETLLTTTEACPCLAYGFVQSIDRNGRAMNHPANKRKFEFSGNRFIRRCKYFIAPDFGGKANPIYGLMPLQQLKDIGISSLYVNNNGRDMIFLYGLLNSMEIRHGGNVFLYKRILCESAAGEIAAKSNSSSRIVSALKNVLGWSMLTEYVKRSTIPESLCLVLCYPFCVSRSIAYKIRRLMML